MSANERSECWLECFHALRCATKNGEILAACRAFEGAAWADVEPTWNGLLEAARSRGDQDRRA